MEHPLKSHGQKIMRLMFWKMVLRLVCQLVCCSLDSGCWMWRAGWCCCLTCMFVSRWCEAALCRCKQQLCTLSRLAMSFQQMEYSLNFFHHACQRYGPSKDPVRMSLAEGRAVIGRHKHETCLCCGLPGSAMYGVACQSALRFVWQQNYWTVARVQGYMGASTVKMTSWLEVPLFFRVLSAGAGADRPVTTAICLVSSSNAGCGSFTWIDCCSKATCLKHWLYSNSSVDMLISPFMP